MLSVWKLKAAYVLAAVLLAVVSGRPSFGLNPYCPPHANPVPNAGEDPRPDQPCPATPEDRACERCRNTPVFTRSGVPTYSTTDLSVPGPGMPVALTRTYLASSRFVGMLGFGWITPFEERLTEETDGVSRRAILLLGSGTVTSFPDQTSQRVYGANADGNPWTLAYNTLLDPLKWTLFLGDGSSKVFDAQGRLERVESAEGESLALSYYANQDGGTLRAVYDPNRTSNAASPVAGDRILLFPPPGSNGFVAGAQDANGRFVAFTQDGYGDLTEVLGADGWTTVYGYKTGALAGSPGALCSIPHLLESMQRRAPGGEEFPALELAEYGASPKLSAMRENGRTVAWSYPVSTDASALRTTTLEEWVSADGAAQSKKLYMDSQGRIVKIERKTGTTTALTTQRYYDLAETEPAPVNGAVLADYTVEDTSDDTPVWTRTARDSMGRTVSVTRDFTQSADASKPGYSETPGLNLRWVYLYDYASIPGNPLLTEIQGPPGYSRTKMEYYTATDTTGAEGGVAGKLWKLKRVNTDAGEDLLATYTYVLSGAAKGQAKRVTAGGAETVYTYDSATGALTSTTLPKNTDDAQAPSPVVGYEVNGLQQVWRVTDQAGAVTELLYDPAGRTKEVQPPDPHSGQASAAYGTKFGFDTVESATTYGVDTDFDGTPDPLVKSTVTDPNGRVTSRYSDLNGRVWAVVDAAGNTTKYAYFPGGLLKSITDANLNTTSYTYDGFDRLKTVTDPYGKITAYTYFVNGKLKTRTDAKGQVLTYAYDRAGRLATKTYGSAGSVTFTYEGDRVKTVTDTYHPQITTGQAQAYSYAYDVRLRLASVTSPTGTVTYTYEANDKDRVASVTDGADASKIWSYAYYPDGSLKTITAPEGAYTYTYNAVGQVANVAYPNASGVKYAYDLQHRLKQIQNAATTSPLSLISQYDYAYDELRGPVGSQAPLRGMITSVKEWFRQQDNLLVGGADGLVTAYDYDALYQLTQAVYPDYAAAFTAAGSVLPAPPWSNQTHGWTYDPIGNRSTYKKTDSVTQAVLDLATYAYNLSNKGPQLTGVIHTNTSPAESFTYDNNGNTATQVAGGVTTTYTWDMDDKMAGLTTTDNSNAAAYTYSYNGDRLKRTLTVASNPAATWTYLYDREDILKVDQGGSSPMYMTQGAGIDNVLAETTAAGTSYAYKHMLSSVLQLANASGGVNNYTYDAWGQATNWPVPAVDPNPYGYTGREWENAGNFHYRKRMYLPNEGIFTAPDVVSPSLNYVYVGNMPLLFSDPTGKYKWCIQDSDTKIDESGPSMSRRFNHFFSPKTGSQTPYNCMAWGIGYTDRWIQPGNTGINPGEIPGHKKGGYGCTPVACSSPRGSSPCSCKEHQIRVNVPLHFPSSWHVYKQSSSGSWCAKQGEGERCYGIEDPDLDFSAYGKMSGLPSEQWAIYCYCCPNLHGGGDPCWSDAP